MGNQIRYQQLRWHNAPFSSDREICIFVSNTDPVNTINYNYKLLTELKERFNKITIINFIKIQKKKSKSQSKQY